MTQALPLVSIIMAAYNRAATIERAVESVLKQTYPNIELIIIDDGSSDQTVRLLDKYLGSKVKLVKHEINRGVTAAKNSGLNLIGGEWFTILDSDDEIVPDAIEQMMKIPLEKDPAVTAITCNCIDTTTNRFSGRGLDKDQYMDVNTVMNVCQGEFWGITHTSLLGTDRFNERLRGFEATLWFKIDDRAKRYYCHKGLRIYHTEGDDRIMKSTYDFAREVQLYQNLLLENEFLVKLKKYRPDEYLSICRTGLIVLRTAGKADLSKCYYKLLPAEARNGLNSYILKWKWFADLYQKGRTVKYYLSPLKRIFKKP